MTAKYYIVFNKDGIRDFYKSDRFQLGRGEYAVEVEFSVDPAVFKPVPVLRTSVHIPAEAVIRPMDISTETTIDDAAPSIDAPDPLD